VAADVNVVSEHMSIRPLYRSFTTQAQIDAQYDTAMSVPDEPGELRHFTVQSEIARERLRCVLDVPFGPTHDETLDIFPAEQPNAPVFVFFHGGYWRSLSSKEFSCVALGLQPLGITTVVPNYALCPRVSLDEVTRQARAAVSWVLRDIHQHGGDPHRVAIGGHSAGAHLAAMCLQTRWVDDYGFPADPLRGGVLVSGVYDIEPLRYSYLQPQIQLDDGVMRRNSPMFGVRRCATPIVITWGETESTEFARQARTFAHAWQDAGNQCECEPLPGAHHCSVIHGFEDPSSRLARWLSDTLAPVEFGQDARHS